MALKIKPQTAVIVAIKWADGNNERLIIIRENVSRVFCIIDYSVGGRSGGFPFCEGECQGRNRLKEAI